MKQERVGKEGEYEYPVSECKRVKVKMPDVLSSLDDSAIVSQK